MFIYTCSPRHIALIREINIHKIHNSGYYNMIFMPNIAHFLLKMKDFEIMFSVNHLVKYLKKILIENQWKLGLIFMWYFKIKNNQSYTNWFTLVRFIKKVIIHYLWSNQPRMRYRLNSKFTNLIRLRIITKKKIVENLTCTYVNLFLKIYWNNWEHYDKTVISCIMIAFSFLM